MTESKYHSRLLLIGLLLLLTVIHRDDATADVGPPPAQPGSSLSPGEFSTNVGMVSEEVQITIDDDPYQAFVWATFHMRNNSSEDEAFEVWFPLGERLNVGKKLGIVQVADFKAWVDNIEMEITIEDVDEWDRVWAHWPVSFPAGTPVSIRVTYTLSPEASFEPTWFSRFDYILETGAGWQGVIGKAEITVRTPYLLHELDSLLGIGDTFYAWPDGYSSSPLKVKWVFYDFEPTEADNINFRLLDPTVWQTIRDSYKTLESSPEDWEAHWNLALGLTKWMMSQESALYHGLIKSSPNLASISELVADSHLKVLELAPPDAHRYNTALGYFRRNPGLIESAKLGTLFSEALEYFPGDEDLTALHEKVLEDGLIEEEPLVISPSPPEPSATATISNPISTDIMGGSSQSTNPRSLFLVLGIIFIGTATGLFFFAVKRSRR
ncbi:MAG: hypothetical protein WBB69_06115 [Anaerolineales bacterium]